MSIMNPRPQQRLSQTEPSYWTRSAPGWWRQIDLEALKLSDCDACVCGQLWEEYGSTFP